MSYLLIVGAGGHGRVVADAASASRQWDLIEFADKKYPDIRKVCEWPVVCRDEIRFFFNKSSNLNLVVAIGNNVDRVRKSTTLLKHGIHLTTIIHPSAQISPSVIIDRGSVVLSGVVVNNSAVVGFASILNTGSIIEHDCVLGEGVHIGPGAVLSGGVHVGDRSWIGVGASLKQNISIGNDVVIGAGSVVVKDIPSNSVAFGVPARVVKKNV